jgi:hypothetical protein
MRTIFRLIALLALSTALCSLAHGQLFVQCESASTPGAASSQTVTITTSPGSFLVSATQEITDNTTTWTENDDDEH